MADKNDIVYFEVNNWFAGSDYPAEEPFLEWLRNDLNIRLRSDSWAKENKLCIVETLIDMSSNFCVTATREWVEKNCPRLLSAPELAKFLRQPDEDGSVYGQFDCEFLEYAEKNFGVEFRDDDDWDDDDWYDGDWYVDDEDEEDDEEENAD